MTELQNSLLSAAKDIHYVYFFRQPLLHSMLLRQRFKSNLFHDLNDILIAQEMFFTASLRLVLCGLSPHPRVVEFCHDAAVQSIAKLLDSRVSGVQYNGFIVVWNLALRLGVYSNHVTSMPNLFHQLLEVPFVLRRDWYVVLTNRKRNEKCQPRFHCVEFLQCNRDANFYVLRTGIWSKMSSSSMVMASILLKTYKTGM